MKVKIAKSFQKRTIEAWLASHIMSISNRLAGKFEKSLPYCTETESEYSEWFFFRFFDICSFRTCSITLF